MSDQKGKPSVVQSNDQPDTASTGNGIFDNLKAVKLPANYEQAASVNKLQTVRVTRPDKSWWFQIHPGEDRQLDALLYKDKSAIGGTEYFVLPGAYHLFEGRGRPVRLLTGVTAQPQPPIVFLWPLSRSKNGAEEREDAWGESARAAAELAKEGWVQMASNMPLSAYETFLPAQPTATQPQWPEESLSELLEIGFKGRIIADESHPIVQQLSGVNL